MDAVVPIRVLLVDDQPVVRVGLRTFLSKASDVTVVGEAHTGPEAVEKSLELRPDVVILDIALQRMAGLEALAAIHQARPETRIVVFSRLTSVEDVRRSIRAGAAGYMTKDQDPTALLKGIRSVHGGGTCLSPHLVDLAVAAFARPLVSGPAAQLLTPRETKVLQLLAQAKSPKEIAALLAISPRTVGAHRRSIMKKLDIHNFVELVRYALQTGWSKPD